MSDHRAEEPRRWVRLTRTCNNRCVFCHDHGCHDGARRPLPELEQELRAGLAEGAARLILSGGEPTLHPGFLELVSRGKALGYRWVQVVSNGRMFAYPGFAARAEAAGLDEATFSIHGHTPELHDRLTGVPGSFAQALAGLRNLQAAGRVVVNADLVLNAWNLPALPEIIDFLLGQGLREFDLLWLVPFGRAWERRAELFVRPEEAAPGLREAILRARRAGAVVWTNRLPAAALEGLEQLLQDPHKLLDEVRGREAELRAWIERGEPMACRHPERCGQCFMAGLCELIAASLDEVRRGQLGGLRLRWEERTSPVARRWLGRTRSLWLEAPSPALAARWLRSLAARPTAVVLELVGEPGARVRGALPGDLVLASAEPAWLERLLAAGGVEAELILDRRSAAWVAARAKELGRQAGRWVFSLRRFDSREAVEAEGCDPHLALLPLGPHGLRLRGLPLCAAGRRTPEDSSPFLSLSALDARGGIALQGLVEHYLREGYSLFSSRCARCGLRSRCAGMPVQHARHHGLGRLAPVPAEADGRSPD